jgi:hypothetical protein
MSSSSPNGCHANKIHKDCQKKRNFHRKLAPCKIQTLITKQMPPDIKSLISIQSSFTHIRNKHIHHGLFSGEENNTRTAIQSLTNSSLHIPRSKTETPTHNQKYFPQTLFLLSLLHSFLFHSLSLSAECPFRSFQCLSISLLLPGAPSHTPFLITLLSPAVRFVFFL